MWMFLPVLFIVAKNLWEKKSHIHQQVMASQIALYSYNGIALTYEKGISHWYVYHKCMTKTCWTKESRHKRSYTVYVDLHAVLGRQVIRRGKNTDQIVPGAVAKVLCFVLEWVWRWWPHWDGTLLRVMEMFCVFTGMVGKHICQNWLKCTFKNR